VTGAAAGSTAPPVPGPAAPLLKGLCGCGIITLAAVIPVASGRLPWYNTLA